MFRFYYNNELLAVSTELEDGFGFYEAIKENNALAKACYNYVQGFGYELPPYEDIDTDDIVEYFIFNITHDYMDFPDQFCVCEYGIEIFEEKIAGNYAKRKAMAQSEAIDYQNTWINYQYSYGELAFWGDYFEELGRKYGLLKEFRENAII